MPTDAETVAEMRGIAAGMRAHAQRQSGQDNGSATARAQRELVAAANAIEAWQREAATRKYPTEYVRSRTSDLRLAMKVAAGRLEDTARAEVNEKRAEASALRARAEATRDPSLRVADEMERARLIAGPEDAGSLYQRARAMLQSGQPERAAFLFDAARAKGLRTFDGHEFGAALDDALDESVADRKKARVLEDESDVIAADSASIGNRTVAAGLRIAAAVLPDDPDNSRMLAEAARLASSGRLAEYVAAQRRGERYSDPVDGMRFDGRPDGAKLPESGSSSSGAAS